MRKSGIFILAMAAALWGCGGSQPNSNLNGANYAQPASPNPKVTAAATEFLTKGSGAKALSAANHFGFELLRTLQAGSPDENVLVSPYSVSTALAMTLNGTKGETHQAMVKALALGKLRDQEVNEAFKTLNDMLLQPSDKVEFRVANSLWTAEGTEFKSDFLKVNRSYYNAHLGNADISKPEGVQMVNKWVSELTSGRIKSILNEDQTDYKLVLLNAVYFKGQWAMPFDAEATKAGTFTPAKGEAQSTSFMANTGTYAHFGNAKYQALRMPFGDGRSSMIVMLPSEGTVSDLLKALNPTMITDLAQELKPKLVALRIPKFTAEYGRSLKEPFTKLGLEALFAQDADLGNMYEGRLWLDDVKHKAFFKIDEEGAEAAATTGVVAPTAAPADKPLEFNADRPFIYLLVDNSTQTVLFAGTYQTVK